MSDDPAGTDDLDEDRALPDEAVLDEHVSESQIDAVAADDDAPSPDDDVAHPAAGDLLDDAADVGGTPELERPESGRVPDATED